MSDPTQIEQAVDELLGLRDTKARVDRLELAWGAVQNRKYGPVDEAMCALVQNAPLPSLLDPWDPVRVLLTIRAFHEADLSRIGPLTRLTAIKRLSELLRQLQRVPGTEQEFYRRVYPRYAREWVTDAVNAAHRLPKADQADCEKFIQDHFLFGDECVAADCDDGRLRDLLVDRWALQSRLAAWTAVTAEIAYLLCPCANDEKTVVPQRCRATYERRRKRYAMWKWCLIAVMSSTCLLGLLALVGQLTGSLSFGAPLLVLQEQAWVYFPPSVLTATLLFWPKLGRVWIPRMGAVSFIGYLGLLGLGQAAGFNDPKALVWGGALGITGIAGSALYLYFGEVAKLIQQTRRTKLARTGMLLLTGLAQSWAIGALGYEVLRRTCDQMPCNPPLFWSWGPLALLIGLIVQSLWEDDPITKPI